MNNYKPLDFGVDGGDDGGLDDGGDGGGGDDDVDGTGLEKLTGKGIIVFNWTTHKESVT